MIEILLKLGLTEKEAKVYLSALELTSAPASKIAQKSGLNRPTTYVILEKLAKLGLMTNFDKGKIQYFTAESPEQLRQLIHNDEEALKERSRELESHLSELNALYLHGDRPRVLVYDSTAAADEYFINKLKHGEQIYGFTDYDALEAEQSNVDAPRIRLKKQIATHVIYTSSRGPIGDASDASQLRTAQFVLPEAFPYRQTVITTAPETGVLIMVDLKTKTTVVIENELLSRSVKAIFDLIWSGRDR